MGRILLVDDEINLRRVLGLLLREDGHEVIEATGAGDARQALGTSAFDLVLTDHKMRDGDALAVLEAAREADAAIPVIVLTAHASIDLAVESMRAGAFDFLTKPFVPEQALAAVRRALERADLVRTNERLKDVIRHHEAGDTMPADSPVMAIIRDQIARVARTSATVLVTGETGVGKELAARAIHRLSPRADEPFIAVNCAAFPDTLLESELFGHERGAFTGAAAARVGLFETAHRGTLFLDEAGEMSVGMQAKLLRVLSDGAILRLGSARPRPVDVRLIVATHRDLAQRVADGTFREDLYYRLAVVPIAIPPLRERREEIPALVDRFLGDIALELKMRRKTVATPALARLAAYDFPGNVRELRNMIERACILSAREELQPEDFSNLSQPAPRAGDAGAAQDPRARWVESLPEPLDLRATTESLERDLIVRALAHAGGNQAQAARTLGVSRSDLSYKLRKHGLAIAPAD
jgi:DNA-binding NtrC family response regulator